MKKTGSSGYGAARFKPKMTRAKKADHTREALFQAAADIVGRVGYAEASVSEITRLAGVAQGTFYRYFPTRQDLFDQLLPKIGEEIETHIRKQVRGSRTGMEVEERSLRAFMEYVAANRRFLRIMNEAETLAPKAYRAQFKHVSKRYVASLKRSLQNGELGDYEESDLEVIAHIMMTARTYLAARYTATNNTSRPPSEGVIRTYLQFVAAGLKASASNGARKAEISQRREARVGRSGGAVPRP